MYVKHFFKMFLGLILMAIIGIGGLVLANYYSKNPDTGASATLPGVSVKK